MTEHAAEIVARDNLELSCCFIQKTAVEKALPEIDKRLGTVSDVLNWFLRNMFNIN